MTLGEAALRIESRLADLDCWGVAVKLHKFYEGVWIVLAYRPEDDSWITWEGTTRYPNVDLHTGHYDMTYEEGMMDFEARGR